MLYGLIAGAVSGPLVVIAWMFSLDFLYPDTAFMATGLEMPGSLVVGAILGAMEGPLLGLLWAIRPRRLTLWWLMVAVAMFALMLGLFKFNPVLGLFAITVPLMMAVSTRVVARIPPARSPTTECESDLIPGPNPAHEMEQNPTSVPNPSRGSTNDERVGRCRPKRAAGPKPGTGIVRIDRGLSPVFER